MTRKPWAKWEVDILKVLYGNMPNKELSELIGKSKQSIQHKAMRLKLTTKLVADYKFCIDCGEKLSRASIYKKTTSRCFPCSMAHHSGENHFNWSGGVSELRSLIHVYLFHAWIKPILVRDDYTCQCCGKRGGDLEVHHDKDRFRNVRDAVLMKYPELSLDDFENKVFIAKQIVKAHEKVSGVTLCVNCHLNTHNRKPSELLETPDSHTHHSIISNDKCDGMKSGMDWTISSQATQGWVEGPTTNAYGPERIMKRHERPAHESVMI